MWIDFPGLVYFTYSLSPLQLLKTGLESFSWCLSFLCQCSFWVWVSSCLASRPENIGGKKLTNSLPLYWSSSSGLLHLAAVIFFSEPSIAAPTFCSGFIALFSVCETLNLEPCFFFTSVFKDYPGCFKCSFSNNSDCCIVFCHMFMSHFISPCNRHVTFLHLLNTTDSLYVCLHGPLCKFLWEVYVQEWDCWIKVYT